VQEKQGASANRRAVSPVAPGGAFAAREARLEEPASQTEYASNYCPRCSARLEGRSCKLICPACGYYMSCSDFY